MMNFKLHEKTIVTTSDFIVIDDNKKYIMRQIKTENCNTGKETSKRVWYNLIGSLMINMIKSEKEIIDAKFVENFGDLTNK
jgi:hypothetical protein